MCNHPVTLWPKCVLAVQNNVSVKPKLVHDIWIYLPTNPASKCINKTRMKLSVQYPKCICPNVFTWLILSLKRLYPWWHRICCCLELGWTTKKTNISGALRYSECGSLFELVFIKALMPLILLYHMSLNLVGLCSTAMSVGEGGCLCPPSPSSSVLYGIRPG